MRGSELLKTLLLGRDTSYFSRDAAGMHSAWVARKNAELFGQGASVRTVFRGQRRGQIAVTERR